MKTFRFSRIHIILFVAKHAQLLCRVEISPGSTLSKQNFHVGFVNLEIHVLFDTADVDQCC
jgi:hypothetical protein